MFSVILLLLVVSSFPTQTTSSAYDDTDAYEVYATILPSEWPLRVAHAKQLVIRRETKAYQMCLKPDSEIQESWASDCRLSQQSMKIPGNLPCPIKRRTKKKSSSAFSQKVTDKKWPTERIAKSNWMTCWVCSFERITCRKPKKVDDQKIKYNDVFQIKILKLAKP